MYCLQASNLGSQVEALLFAVKSTNDFENDMAKRFSGDGAEAADEEVCSFSAAAVAAAALPPTAESFF